MSTYAIGDIQGCFKPFMALLEKINFNPKIDTGCVWGDSLTALFLENQNIFKVNCQIE